jgi:hypothetical protein
MASRHVDVSTARPCMTLSCAVSSSPPSLHFRTPLVVALRRLTCRHLRHGVVTLRRHVAPVAAVPLLPRPTSRQSPASSHVAHASALPLCSSRRLRPSSPSSPVPSFALCRIPSSFSLLRAVFLAAFPCFVYLLRGGLSEYSRYLGHGGSRVLCMVMGQSSML